MNNKGRVTIFGGSGFLGRYIVQLLARENYPIRVAVRRPELAGFLKPLGSLGQIELVAANIRDEASVLNALKGSDTVINLVGILAPSGKQTFEAVQHEGAERIAELSAMLGVRQLVQLSAIGADAKSLSVYARTKAAGEASVLAHFPNAVILRPSVVFGPEDDFFNRFAAMNELAPVMPVVAGKSRFQPVYVGDVASAVSGVLAGRAAPGQIYELGGPDIITMREVIEKIGEITDHHPMKLPLPFWMAKMIAFFTKPLPNPPVTSDQLKLLARDNVVSDQAQQERRVLSVLSGIAPRSMDMIVPGYLVNYTKNGPYHRYSPNE